jgi:hypothetical protein
MVYSDILNELSADMKRFNRVLQPPCSASNIDKLKQQSIQKLRHILPDGYSEFLTVTNGFFWNGLLIYACERTAVTGLSDGSIAGFIEENLGYRDFEPMNDYLIFADDGVVLYTYHISFARYEIILRVGLTILKTFNSFEELITNAFQANT